MYRKKMERALRVLDTPRLFLVVRPILVHGRSKSKKRCGCGCNSKRAAVIEEREHLGVLIDAYDGTRSVRSKLDDAGKAIFDEVKKLAVVKRIYCPVRCYEEQVPVIVDRSSRVIYIPGGTRGGKTTVAAERLFSLMLEDGGRGATFAWVSASTSLAWTGMRKLVKGEYTDRRVEPIIPPELIASAPADEKAKDWTVKTVMGDEIVFRAAYADGDNLKSVAFRHGVFDECTASKDEKNLIILRNRTTDSGGSLAVPSTPKRHHWMSKWSKRSPTYSEAIEIKDAGGKWPHEFRQRLVCFDNVWQDPEIIEAEIEALGGRENLTVRREYFGEEVGDGERMWVHYDARRCLVDWTARNIARAGGGWVNLTPVFARHLFYGLSDAECLELGAQDFNVRPMTLLIVKIIARRESDPRDPQSWVLYVEDEVVKVSKSTIEYAHFVASQAGRWNGRGLRGEHYRGLHVVCDKSGFYDEARYRGPDATRDAALMEREGFVMRAPMYSSDGTPRNPPRRVRHQLMHQVMHEGRLLVHRGRCPRLIESLENETDDGTGDQGTRSGTKADQRAGPTDALGYIGYSAFGMSTDIEAVGNDAAYHMQEAAAWG